MFTTEHSPSTLHAVLCCAVLCCAVLCCAVLCCAVLCCKLLVRPCPGIHPPGHMGLSDSPPTTPIQGTVWKFQTYMLAKLQGSSTCSQLHVSESSYCAVNTALLQLP